MKKTIQSKRDAGYLLGPVFYEFCCRLYWAAASYSPEKDALLFMARGGLRLQELFKVFLASNGLQCPVACHPFWISRFAALKMTLEESPEFSYSRLVNEFSYTNCRTLASALLPEELFPEKQGILDELPEEIAQAGVNRENVLRLLYESGKYSEIVQQHFKEQHDLGHRYLQNTFGKYERLHTVDSGWFGSTLGSLQTGCRQWRWDALYFGRWNYKNEVPWYFHDITGLIIDAEGLRGTKPVDVFLEYHHILEAALEPEIPSVEYYLPEDRCNAMIPDWEKAVTGTEQDDLWSGTLDYLKEPHSLKLNDAAKETCRVMKIWKRLLRYPTKEEALLLEVPPRSADFGKKDCTAVFPETSGGCGCTYWRNMKRSLWPAGAIAIHSGFSRRWKQMFWHFARKITGYKGAV